jgi:hyperosmotically inducible protein
MKIKLKLLGPVFLAIMLGGMVGCQTSSESGRSAGRVLDDDTVTTKVETALRDAPTYKFDGVRVSTYDGLVQLSGWVGSADQKAAAEQITRNVHPSQKIFNNISVIQPQPQPQAIGGTPENP